MRILIIADDYPSEQYPGRCVFFQARALAYRQRGHTVAVIAAMHEHEDSESHLQGIPVQRMNDVAQLRTALEQHAPDIVCIHAPTAKTISGMAIQEAAVTYPVVVWIHGWEAIYTSLAHYFSSWRKTVSAWYKDVLRLRRLRSLLSSAHAVVYVSNWLKSTSERQVGFRHPQACVIPNPVDTERFAPPPAGRESSRMLRAIAARSLRHVYGLDIAVQAFSGLTETSLTILGRGVLLDALQSLAQRCQAGVSFDTRPHAHDQMPAIFQQYDVFVAPSRSETQGLAMCEAMSCGLPVVATRVGGIPEFVRDGVDGFLVPPESPAALAEAVRRLLADPERRQAMGRSAREQIRAICDTPVVCAAEEAVMREAIARFYQ